MGRLSIEVTEAQHQKIKALAALSGLSIKDYILRQTLAPTLEAEAMREMEAKIAKAEASVSAGREIHYRDADSLAKDVIASGAKQSRKSVD